MESRIIVTTFLQLLFEIKLDFYFIQQSVLFNDDSLVSVYEYPAEPNFPDPTSADDIEGKKRLREPNNGNAERGHCFRSGNFADDWVFK